jgi:hypothetical protein
MVYTILCKGDENMNYPIHNREELEKLIQEEVINTKEVTEILNCSRQNLSDLNKSGTLIPIKKISNDTLYLKSDVLKRAYGFYCFRINIKTNKEEALKELREDLEGCPALFRNPTFEELSDGGNWMELRLRTMSNPHPRQVQDALVGLTYDAYNTYDELWQEVKRKRSTLAEELNL